MVFLKLFTYRPYIDLYRLPSGYWVYMCCSAWRCLLEVALATWVGVEVYGGVLNEEAVYQHMSCCADCTM